MTEEYYARLRGLFDEVAGLPPADRHAFIDAKVPVGDPLRTELMAMLAANEDSRFLAAAGGSPSPAGAHESSLQIPAQVGAYRILREIGRGGMGIVYLATRNDDVFHKIVALKVISAPFQNAALVERFKRERQILAGLDHPNIARILDGGNLDDGRPYYVMEYVDGTPLDHHCTRADADVPTRLKLVLQVCEAIDYLHGAGIVHCDIKPSNILVTREGRVRLLDFGIAKVHASAPDAAVGRPTLALTPGYGSPEQLAGSGAGPVSDIYSVGVVLYELLSGRLPFADADGRPDLAAQRLRDLPAPPSQGREPAARKTTPLLKSIGPDLDRIVLAALQREPARRYASVRQFADDIQRYLEARPISTRTGSWSYVLRLLVVRNRLSTALAALFVVAAVMAVWMFVAARMDRIRLEAREGEIERLVALLNERVDRWDEQGGAAAQAEKVADVRAAADMMSSGTLQEVSTRAPDPARVKRLIADLRRFLERADQLSQGQPVLRKEIALVYRQVGDFESDDAKPRIVDRAQATGSYQRAAAIVSSVRGDEPEWAREQLSELSVRLEGLGTVLPVELIDPPVVALPSPATPVSQAAKPPPPLAGAKDGRTGPADPVLHAELTERLRSTVLVAGRTRQNLDDLQARLASQGQVLRSDLSASMRQIDGLLDQASKSLEDDDLSLTDDLLQRITYELRRLAQSVGG